MARAYSPQAVAVVLALAGDPTRWRYGYELSLELAIKAGSMYPILMRLADRGLVETAWESAPPEGRPPRHLYRLTGPGRALAGDLARTTAVADDGRAARAASPATSRVTGSSTGPVTGPATGPVAEPRWGTA